MRNRLVPSTVGYPSDSLASYLSILRLCDI